MRVATQFVERLKTLDVQKLGNTTKFSKLVGGRASCPVSLSKIKP